MNENNIIDDIKRVSVLFITHYSSIYGANLSLLNVAEKLKQRGICVHVICPDDGDLVIELRKRSIPYAVIPFRTDLVSLKGNKIKVVLRKYKWLALNYLPNKMAVKKIAEYIESNNITLVHTNSICASVGARASYKTKRVHVWHIRECLEIFYNDTLLMTRTRKKMYRYTSRFIAISDAVKNYESYSTLSAEKVKVVYNGLPSRYSDRVIEKEPDPFIFSIVGVLQEGKRVSDAIKAFAEIQDKLKIESELWVIGGTYPPEDKSFLYELEGVAKDCGVEDKVKFMGYQKDIHTYLSKSHCGVLCSVFESFGRVLVEYMQNKLLVIANDTGASRELIEDNVSGLIYQKNSISSLSEKMLYAAEHYFELTDVIEKGYTQANERFTVDNCIDGIINVYNEVLKQD